MVGQCGRWSDRSPGYATRDLLAVGVRFVVNKQLVLAETQGFRPSVFLFLQKKANWGVSLN